MHRFSSPRTASIGSWRACKWRTGRSSLPSSRGALTEAGRQRQEPAFLITRAQHREGARLLPAPGATAPAHHRGAPRQAVCINEDASRTVQGIRQKVAKRLHRRDVGSLALALLYHRRRSSSAKRMSPAYGRIHLWFVIRCDPKREKSKTTCDD